MAEQITEFVLDGNKVRGFRRDEGAFKDKQFIEFQSIEAFNTSNFGTNMVLDADSGTFKEEIFPENYLDEQPNIAGIQWTFPDEAAELTEPAEFGTLPEDSLYFGFDPNETEADGVTPTPRAVIAQQQQQSNINSNSGSNSGGGGDSESSTNNSISSGGNSSLAADNKNKLAGILQQQGNEVIQDILGDNEDVLGNAIDDLNSTLDDVNTGKIETTPENVFANITALKKRKRVDTEATIVAGRKFRKALLQQPSLLEV